MQLLRPGAKILLVFLFLAYVFPLVGNELLAGSLDSIYRIHPLSARALVILFATFGLFGFIIWRDWPDLSSLRLQNLERLAQSAGEFYRRIRLPWLGAVFILAVWTLWTGQTGYRYAAKGLSEQNSWLLLLMVALGPLLTADVFYSLFVQSNDVPRAVTRLVGDYLLGFTLVFTANGTGAMFQALIAVSYAIWPRALHRMLFLPRGLDFQQVLWRYVIMSLYTVGLFGTSWLFGEGLKSRKAGESLVTSVNRVSSQVNTLVPAPEKSPIEKVSAAPPSSASETRAIPSPKIPSAAKASPATLNRITSFLRAYGNYLVERFSIYYYSFLFTVDPARDQFYHVKEWPLLYPLQTMLFRADFLLGRPFGLAKPKISSLMQLNYQALTAKPDRDSRQGSSAGVLGSFNYVLPLPFNLAAAVGYLCLLAKMIDVLFGRHRHEVLSFFGAVLGLPYLVSFLQSPLDFILIFDDATLYAIVILGIALAERGKQPAEAPPDL